MFASNLDEVLEIVKTFYLKKVGRLSEPKDTMLFFISELGELADAISREDSTWDRNNERNMSVGEELADILMLVLVLANHYQVDITTVLREKMARKLAKLEGKELG